MTEVKVSVRATPWPPELPRHPFFSDRHRYPQYDFQIIGGGAVLSPKEVIYSINPATEEILESFQIQTDAQMQESLHAARKTYSTWRRERFPTRARLMKQAGVCLRQNKPRLAGIMTAEMGKPIVEAEAEVEKCAWNLHYRCIQNPYPEMTILR